MTFLSYSSKFCLRVSLFCFLCSTRYVELFTETKPAASVSQIAGITSIHHHRRPITVLVVEIISLTSVLFAHSPLSLLQFTEFYFFLKGQRRAMLPVLASQSRGPQRVHLSLIPQETNYQTQNSFTFIHIQMRVCNFSLLLLKRSKRFPSSKRMNIQASSTFSICLSPLVYVQAFFQVFENIFSSSWHAFLCRKAWTISL